jgi:MFS family permease
VRYLVLAWLCLAAMIAYVPRNGLGVAEKAVRDDLGLSEGQMGWVLSAFFIGYAFFQIPSAWFGQVWGARRALAWFALAWSISSGVVSLATGRHGGPLALPGLRTWSVAPEVIGLVAGLPLLLAARLGMGVAQAGLFPGSTATVAAWFPATRWALANGLLGSCMQIGAAIAAALTGLLLAPLGWRWVFAVYAVPGVVWAVGFFLWFRDRPEEHPAVNAAELDLIRGPARYRPPGPARADHEPTPWAALFSSPAMFWISGQQFFRAAGYMFYASWFPTFLQETRGTSIEKAGVLTSLPIAAVVVGSAVGGWVSDWVLVATGSRRLSRQALSVASMLGCALLIGCAFFIRDVWPAVLVITAGSFCSAFAGPCAYALTIDMGGAHVAPVFSTMNMAGNFGAAVFPLLVPPLVKGTGSWDAVLFLAAGTYLAAAFCWLLFNPNGTIFDRARTGRPGNGIGDERDQPR